MAINLLNNTNSQINSNTSQVDASASARAVVRNEVANALKAISGLSVGDTIAGQLVSKDGNSIGLLLRDNTLLNTILDSDVNLSMGQTVSFEVRNNQNGQLTLRPMFTNLSNSSTIMEALDAASVATSDDTVKMVDLLMKNNMSIGRDMLNLINREINMYPNASVEDIVMLHKMDIPVDDNSLMEIGLYRNNNQWMLENVEDLAKELTSLIYESLGEDGKVPEELLKAFNNILLPAAEEMNTNEGALLSEEVHEEQSAITDKTVTESNYENTAAKESIVDEKSLKQNSVSEEDLGDNKAGITDQATTNTNQINKFNVFEKISQLPKESLENPQVKKQVMNAVKELFKDNFLMKPKDIGEEKFVQKFYEKTSGLIDQMTKAISESGRPNSELGKTVSNMKSGMNFMNQINELYNYVQLPLKMNDNHANGDLYVYRRKKGRGQAEDGKMTALLHLSMEHLGNMDIFLTLTEGQNLTTKFTLEKEEMIDFIEAHLDMLNERLMKKGYNIGGMTVTNMEESGDNVIDRIVSKDSSNILLSTQSFDARA